MRTVYKNGTVYTGNGFVTDFAVENGKFCFVGETDKATADEVVDLGGKFVCAGFNDSHMHVLNLGNVLTMANLGAHTTSLKEMLDCLRTYIKETGVTPGTWVQGRGFNHDYFADERRFPTRWDLDSVSTEHPICITRACGHICVVNSKALEVLGITKDTPQVAGGNFALDENGEPNGQFFENAVAVVYAGIPEPDEAQLCAMLRASCKRLNRYGITSCQSDDYETFPGVPYKTVQKLLRTPGLMTVRVNEQAQFTNAEALSEYIESGDAYFEDDMFRAGPLKIISDGSLGARTACLSRPYADDENARGIPLYTNAELNGLISLANEKGLSVAVHAIGDGALELVARLMREAFPGDFIVRLGGDEFAMFMTGMVEQKAAERFFERLFQNIRQRRPVQPSLSIRVSVSRSFCRVPSGIRRILAMRFSLTSSKTDLPKILLAQSFSVSPSYSPMRYCSRSSDCFSSPTMGLISAWMSARIRWMDGALARRRTP